MVASSTGIGAIIIIFDHVLEQNLTSLSVSLQKSSKIA